MATPHTSPDPLLDALTDGDDLVADLTRAYLNGNGSDRWLDDWFDHHTRSFFASQTVPPVEPIDPQRVAQHTVGTLDPSAAVVRIVSIEPHYFRGFRALPEPVSLDAALVVIDGRNSSGKTSVGEALEWLLTGELSRRTAGGQGNARELESCIGNQLRPDGEETWVEARFSFADDTRLTLRRVLETDYGPTTTAGCRSRVLQDGQALAHPAASSVLKRLFGICLPLLMQHTLRHFVESEPADRRAYFEGLLRVDGLTHLIEKAVIGSARMNEYASPTGSLALKRWKTLATSCRRSGSKSRLHAAERRRLEDVADAIAAALPTVANLEFPVLVAPNTSLADARRVIDESQRAARQHAFPLLATLRPKRMLDSSVSAVASPEALTSRGEALNSALAALGTARRTASAVTDAQLAVAKALADLTAAGLVPSDSDIAAMCPLCAYPDFGTLTEKRLITIRAAEPARAAVHAAASRVAHAGAQFLDALSQIRTVRGALIPPMPTAADWDTALESAPDLITAAARLFRERHAAATAALAAFDAAIDTLGQAVAANPVPVDMVDTNAELIAAVTSAVTPLLTHAAAYASAFATLERAVGVQAQDDPDYALRGIWLAVAKDPDATARDLAWERAKEAARDSLQETRQTLIQLRHDLIESRRVALSTGMTEIWKLLRADRYTAFSQLFIPEPRGKGLKVEIEVKAILDDGLQRKEVDALRVFSESQVNVLGIAAFVTRAKMIGHRVLVFDDPVQSMDEDHFKTFAGPLLCHLLDSGFQVIVLTHNDTFARDVSYAHSDSVDYATMNVEHRRRTGCAIDPGSRRFSERLKRVERKADDGALSDGWRSMRLAIERLYVLIYKKHGPERFNPASWGDQTAEYMFNEGVGSVLDAKAPGRSPRLKEILDMTAAGAHDKAPRGATDLLSAVAELREVAAACGIVD